MISSPSRAGCRWLAGKGISPRTAGSKASGLTRGELQAAQRSSETALWAAMRTAEDGLDDSGFKGLVRPRRVGQLLIQGLPIPDAALEELGPFGHHGDRIRLLGQQAPQRRL